MPKAKNSKPIISNEPEDLFIKNQICFSIYSTSRYMIQAYQPYLEPFALTYAQFLVMLCLWEKDAVPVTDIGLKLDLDSGTLSPLLKKLEAKEYIRRVRQVNDERVVLVHLTAKGEKIKDKIFKVRNQMLCDSGLTLDQLVRLKDQLEVLSKNLNTAIKSHS